MRELFACNGREEGHEDMNVHIKKINHSVQKILTIFDQNGEILPIVPRKIQSRKQHDVMEQQRLCIWS